jgi:hypothetical protein
MTFPQAPLRARCAMLDPILYPSVWLILRFHYQAGVGFQVLFTSMAHTVNHAAIKISVAVCKMSGVIQCVLGA